MICVFCQEHHNKDCVSEILNCYHCKHFIDLSINIKQSAIDHENCAIHMQEYQLANERITDLVNKYDDKYGVPIFKNKTFY